MRRIDVTWMGEPISEDELQKKLTVEFWKPEVSRRLPAAERKAYRDLKWWDAKAQKHLSPEARAAYRQLDEDRSRERFTSARLSERLSSIRNPLQRLEAVDAALTLLQSEVNELSLMRRDALLEADEANVSTRELADVMHVTLPRVRQIIIDARRKAGLPVRPQHGGRKTKSKRGDTKDSPARKTKSE